MDSPTSTIAKPGETLEFVHMKGAWIADVHGFASGMAQNFWLAIVAWTVCFTVTIIVSLSTKRKKTDAELTGLVYSLTKKEVDSHEPWYIRPAIVGSIVLAITLALNLYFW